MTDATLLASLHLEAVLPALPLLAAHDRPLADTLAGPDVAVGLLAPGELRARLAVQEGRASVDTRPRPGDVRLWFPTVGQLNRAFNGPAGAVFALPIGGLARLPRARRLVRAARRFETLLNHRAEEHLALHAWANLAVGIRAAITWLARHPDGPDARARLGEGAIVFACPAFPRPLWADLSTLAAGAGSPPRPEKVRVEFADLPTVLAELDHRLDAPAALGLGTLRVSGFLPLADQFGQLMLRAGNLLKQASRDAR